jgi:hypothetical protein
VFALGKPFQPSLMFVGEARSLPSGGARERLSVVILNVVMLNIIVLSVAMLSVVTTLISFIVLGRQFFGKNIFEEQQKILCQLK